MLLDNLLEASIIELHKLREVVDICNDITEVLLEHHEILLGRDVGIRGVAILGPRTTLVESLDDLTNLLVAAGNSTANLDGLDLLLGVNLIELLVERLDELLLVLRRPLATFRPWVLPRGRRDEFPLELVLQVIVGDVIPLVLLDHAGPQLLAEFHDDKTGPEIVAAATGIGLPVDFLAGEILNYQHEDIQTTAVYLEMPGKLCRTKGIWVMARSWFSRSIEGADGSNGRGGRPSRSRSRSRSMRMPISCASRGKRRNEGRKGTAER
jgi:hypothetical protein